MTNILIVDDDKNFIETLDDNFKVKDATAEISVAKSAKEALVLMDKSVPSIIILDVQLPGMQGTEFLKVIKGSPKLKDIPVILISAKYTEPADRTDAVLNGAASFFSKPIDIDDLWTEIKYLLDNKG